MEQQLTIFDELCEEVKITKPIRLIELFAGYGSQAMALERLGADFTHHKVIEFDRFAVNSYNAVHGTNFEPIDIRDIHASDLEITDTDNYCYIMTYSFPCTDLSIAGKMKGMKKGSGTRSGLLWEVERLLKEMNERPQILLMENVTQVHGKANIEWMCSEYQILDDAEKRYLKCVIMPFRNEVKSIFKLLLFSEQSEQIAIQMQNDSGIFLPCFEKGTMYQGMEEDKRYTLEELGL